MKILIVDDNDDERKLLKMFLRQAEYQVVEAENGKKGLELASKENPDLIIFDVSMPVMDGFQFLYEIKAGDDTKNIPMIAYSSVYTDPDEQNFIMNLGADGYIPKGNDFQEFIVVLNDSLNKFKIHKPTPFAMIDKAEFIQRYSSLIINKIEDERNKLLKSYKLLSQSEEKYLNLFNSIRDVILITSMDRQIIDVNGLALKTIFGYTPEEVIGKNVRLLYVSDEDYESSGREFFYIDEPIAPKNLTYRFKRKNGEVFTGEIHAFKLIDADGKSLGNISIIQDISEKILFEKKLVESEARLRLSIQSANIGLWSFNVQTNETYLSPEWKKQLGYEDKEIPDDNNEWLSRLHPEDKDRVLSIQNEYLKNQENPYNLEFRLRHKDGTYKWILSQGTLIKDENGEPLRVLGSHIDITERKLAEEKIRESYNKTNKNLEDIIYAMAKIVEIRDPYTAGHQRRVADLCTAIAREIGLEESRVNGLYLVSLVHDIGKIYIPSEILNKPGKLNHFEFNIVKTHAELGYDILKNIEFPWPVAGIVQQYHERMDGSGYPRGIKGEEMMLEARILAVADVVEAMSSHRPHRPAHPLSAALKEIENGRGITYDTEVVDACLKLFKEKGYKLLTQ